MVKEIVATPYDVVMAYKTVWATDEGRIVLGDLMRLFAFNTRSTMPQNGDRHIMDLQEGQRTVLIHIGNKMEEDPNLAEETANASY